MPKAIHVTDWITVILLADVSLIAILRYFFPGRFVAFIRVPFRGTYFTEFAQEKEQPFWFNLILETVMVISISLFIYTFVFIGRGIVADDYLIFLRIFLVTLLFLTLQRFFHSLTAVLFKMKKSLNQLMAVKDAYLRWLAPLLTLLTALAVFAPLQPTVLLIVGIISLLTMYTLGVVRGSAFLAGANTLSMVHIIFYLCTLEIIPVLVLVKMLF